MTDPNAVNAMVRSALDGTGDGRYPANLGVFCDWFNDVDECGLKLSGDFVVHEDDSRAVRLGYVLDYAAREGWTVCGRVNAETALTFCPDHKDAAPPVTIPADHEFVGTQFPGQMPEATWDELMAWFEANGFDPSRSPLTRDIVIGATIDRWQGTGVDGNGLPVNFGTGPARADGVMLREGEEWSHERPGHEGSARPVRFVSTPVTVPLPQHLRTAIEKAAAGQDIPGNMLTPVEWSAQYAVKVDDPTGWDDSRSWHDPISEDEFVRRCKASTFHRVPLTEEQAGAQLLHDLLTGKVALDSVAGGTENEA